jgi:hypothetical protein
MSDEIDLTTERMEAELTALVKAARGEIPKGKAGECAECFEYSARLINGHCAPCRDTLRKRKDRLGDEA